MREPTLFGGYELLERIAVGGMAEVFRARARRPGGVSKVVCLKRIHPRLSADPDFVAMFIEEARVSLALAHGAIVPAFDFGCADGQYFLVMELVDGRDLASVLGRSRLVCRPFPADLAVHVVEEVLDALTYVHGWRDEQGRTVDIVHRDVNPSNVMVTRAGEVRILDFGIALSALRELRTRTGVVKGKPGYMAPEQLSGLRADARTDIYACGVMLFELLTGERPSVDERLDRALVASRCGEGRLGVAVGRALAPRSEDRYESAAAMREALSSYLVERDARPSARSLAAFVESLFRAEPDATDWSIAAGAVDRHLAAIVEEADLIETAPAGPQGPPEGGAEQTVETPPPFAPEAEDARGVDATTEPAALLDGPTTAKMAVQVSVEGAAATAPERAVEPDSGEDGEPAAGGATLLEQRLRVARARRPWVAAGLVVAVAVLLGVGSRLLPTRPDDPSLEPSGGGAPGGGASRPERPDEEAAEPRSSAAEAGVAEPALEAGPAGADSSGRARRVARARRPSTFDASSSPVPAPAGLEAPSPRELQAALVPLRPYFRLCMARSSPPVTTARLRLQVRGDGTASYLGATPEPPPSVAWCLRKVVGDARLPVTGSAPVTLVHAVHAPELDR